MIRRNYLSTIWLFLCFILLILDSGHTLSYAQEGINICITTVIPTLFPLLYLSSALNRKFYDLKSRSSEIICKLTHIPQGNGLIFILGVMGGYPLGARLINENCRSGNLNQEDGKRMMGFCCNPGPAFIFGICGSLFTGIRYPLFLWLNVIFSALLTGILLPKTHGVSNSKSNLTAQQNSEQILPACIQAMAVICGWVILFKILVDFLRRWVLWYFPNCFQIIIVGLLEITNGCITLSHFPDEILRYLIASIFLSSGGLCVAFQTKSVATETGLGKYFIGKIIQTACCLLCSCISLPFLVPELYKYAPYIGGSILGILFIYVGSLLFKKRIAFEQKLRYNKRN